MSSADYLSGSLFFVCSGLALSLHHSRARLKRAEKEHQVAVMLSPPILTNYTHPQSESKSEDMILHHIQNLSEYYPSANVKNSKNYFHFLNGCDFVIGTICLSEQMKL